MGQRKQSKLRIFYATGSGDVVRTFRHWQRRERDPLEIAETYSGQFFDIASRMDAVARVVSANPRRDRDSSDCFVVENSPRKYPKASGVWYFLDHLIHDVILVSKIICWRPNILILSGPLNWWLFAPLRVLGVKIIASVHGAFWTGAKPQKNGIVHRVMRNSMGWFWRHGPEATLCISSEIAAQVRILARQPRGRLLVCTPAFERSMFEQIEPAVWRERQRVLYAGRITKPKGVWDMLEAAIDLSKRSDSLFQWTVCGEGADLEALKVAAAGSCVKNSFECVGHVDRKTLSRLLEMSTIAVAPSQRELNEGLNKSVIEAALAGLPVITTAAVPAKDLVGAAAVVVDPNNPKALADAILRIGADPDAWERTHQAALAFRESFFACDRTWGTLLEQILKEMSPAP